MIILALDQGTQLTGHALIEYDELADKTRLINYGTIDLRKNKDTIVRDRLMGIGVDAIVSNSNPDIVVFEGITLQKNPQVVIKLGQLQGCIMSAIWRHDLPFHIYLPTAWRKRLEFKQGGGVKREELKKQAFDFVKNSLGIEDGISEDEAEAIAIGLAHIVALKNPEDKKENSKDGSKKRKKSSRTKKGVAPDGGPEGN